jgi:hypothetical protein
MIEDSNNTACQATPRKVLLAHLMNPCIPKDEVSWAALAHITILEEALRDIHRVATDDSIKAGRRCDDINNLCAAVALRFCATSSLDTGEESGR